MKKKSTSHDWTVCRTTFNITNTASHHWGLWTLVYTQLPQGPPTVLQSGLLVFAASWFFSAILTQLMLVSLKTLYCCMLQWTFLRMSIAMCLISILLVFKICCLKIVLLKKVNMHFFLNFRLWQKMDRFIPCFDPWLHMNICANTEYKFLLSVSYNSPILL